MKISILLKGVGDLLGVGSLNYIAYTVSSSFDLKEAQIIAACAIVYSVLRIIYLIFKLNDGK